jgi:hypothetical protein
MSDANDQMYVANGMKLAEAILRAQTGAAAPEHEVRTYALTYLPQYYESKEVQRKKLTDVKESVKNLGVRAGPAGGKMLAPMFDYYLEGRQPRKQQQQPPRARGTSPSDAIKLD